LRRSAFQEAIAHLGRAIAMADRAAATKAPAGATTQRVKVQADYAHALQMSKGFGAAEARAAFARVQELGQGVGDENARFAAYYGQGMGEVHRGEFASARRTAERFLEDAEASKAMSSTVGSLRLLGWVCFLQGEFRAAHDHLDRAVREYDADRDMSSRDRFAVDSGVGARGYLAMATWQLGSPAASRGLWDEAAARADALGHVPTRTNTYLFRAFSSIIGGDDEAARTNAEAAAELSLEFGMELVAHWADLALGFVQGRREIGGAGAKPLDRALTNYRSAGYKSFAPLYDGLAAWLGSEGGDASAAAERIDAALALAQETGERWTDSFLHRLRGDILLKRDPGNPGPAEEAFLAAIVAAQAQKARSYELRAALSLAKLYQSTARPADAQAVLAPALEGFSPMPEMPEIAEAQALLATLAETNEVKNAAAARQRRLHLQTAYGQAMMWAHGHAAAETSTAFTRAHELARLVENPAERFSAYYGLWVGAYTRGEIGAAQEMASLFLREIEAQPHLPEASVGHRIFGATCWYLGDFAAAHRHLETAFGLYDRAAHADFANRFGQDVAVSAGYFDALALFSLGHVDEAVRRIDHARSSAEATAHVPTLIQLRFWRFFLGALRRRPDWVAADAQALSALVAEHNVNTFVGYATFAEGWTKWALGERDLGMMGMFKGIEVTRSHGYRLCLPFYEAALAEAEAEAGNVSTAIERVERALAEIDETGERWCEAEMHRIRGDILLKADPENPARAVEAYLTAIAVAEAQKARSFELQAALALAKLYQSTGRPADAHAVLAPALEGFAPTPEMPEIAEAEALLTTLE
jgi:predicted ATPase